jgi:hypothetical protein
MEEYIELLETTNGRDQKKSREFDDIIKELRKALDDVEGIPV